MAQFSRIVVALSAHTQPARLARMQRVLESRTATVSLVCENLSNVSGVLCVADVFGVARVHVIDKFASSDAALRHGEDKTQRPATRWLSITHHRDTWSYLEAASASSATVLSLTVAAQQQQEAHSGAMSMLSTDWSSQLRPLHIVLANEERGPSTLMARNSVAVELPCVGMTKPNASVQATMLLSR